MSQAVSRASWAIAFLCAGCEANVELSAEPDAAPDGPRDATVPSFDAGPSELIDASSPWFDAGLPGEPMIDATALDAAPAEVDACVPDGGAPQLAGAVVMHACLHGSDGPFRVVTGGPTAEAAPDVSRPHTLFTVLAGTAESVQVSYLPAAPGDHVLFVARGELTAAKQAGSALALERRGVDCAVLPESYLLQLVGVEPVELTLRAGSDRVAIVIESLASWGADSWQHACAAGPVSEADASACRKSGPCSSDAECCSYCHDYDHCH
jgi:hypothetical protein